MHFIGVGLIAAAAAMTAAAADWYDLSSRAAVAAAYHNVFVPSANTPMGWTGSLTTGDKRNHIPDLQERGADAHQLVPGHGRSARDSHTRRGTLGRRATGGVDDDRQSPVESYAGRRPGFSTLRRERTRLRTATYVFTHPMIRVAYKGTCGIWDPIMPR